MTGTPRRRQPMLHAWNRFMRGDQSCAVIAAASTGLASTLLKSSPAQNDGPSPRTITARTSRAPRSRSWAARTARSISKSTPLCFSGRLRTTWAIAPSTVTRTRSFIPSTVLPPRGSVIVPVRGVMAARVLPAHPPRAVGAVFALPDRDARLDAIDERPARAVGLVPVGGARGADDGHVAHDQRPPSVHHGETPSGQVARDLVGDALHLGDGHRGVRLVFELHDRPSFAVVADD